MNPTLSHKNLLMSYLNIGLMIFGLTWISTSFANGIEWLASTTQTDGSYQTPQDITASYQTTTETLRTFNLLNQNTQPSIPSALNYIRHYADFTQITIPLFSKVEISI